MIINNPVNVRILLDNLEKKNDESHIIIQGTGESLKISNFDAPHNHYDMVPSNVSIVYNHKNNTWLVNNKKLCIKKLLISTINNDDYIMYNDHYYQGSLCLFFVNEKIFVVNHINIEEYVENVLHYETCILWPLENHKLFAIVIRTFALNKCLQNHKYSNYYDIKATIAHQLYKGVKDKNDVIRKAVEETKGVIITHNDKPIISMYHICCGSVIPAKCSGFDFKNHPYLARKYACNACQKCPYYKWTVEYSFSEVCKKLSEMTKKSVVDFSIKKVSYTRAGSIKHLSLFVYVNTNKKNKKQKPQKIVINLKHSEFKKFFNITMQRQSAYFSLENNNHKFVISGKGRGHHMGVCQYGALTMVNEGKSAAEIINFYFPNTKIQKYLL